MTLRIPGFIVVGPAGPLPGTFGVSRPRAMKNAVAVTILNRYKAAAVRVRAAEIVVAPDRGWCQPRKMRAKLDKRVAEIRKQGR
jgi:hypothetical protein